MRSFGYRPKQKPLTDWTIVNGDLVQVTAGRYRGTQGKVTKVNRKENLVTVQGANLKFKQVDDEEMVRRRKTI